MALTKKVAAAIAQTYNSVVVWHGIGQVAHEKQRSLIYRSNAGEACNHVISYHARKAEEAFSCVQAAETRLREMGVPVI